VKAEEAAKLTNKENNRESTKMRRDLSKLQEEVEVLRAVIEQYKLNIAEKATKCSRQPTKKKELSRARLGFQSALLALRNPQDRLPSDGTFGIEKKTSTVFFKKPRSAEQQLTAARSVQPGCPDLPRLPEKKLSCLKI
jgi:hypothetical protein